MSTSTQHIHTQILQKTVTNTQSTHGVAAEATAARLLFLLERRAQQTGRINSSDQLKLEAYMAAYLNAHTEGVIPPVDADISAHPVILLCQTILRLKDENLPRSPINGKSVKQVIFEQLKKIVGHYPGGTAGWSDHDEKWAQNRYFDTQVSNTKILTRNSAQVLNLVCEALLDKANHVIPEVLTHSEVSKGELLPVSSASSSTSIDVHDNASSRLRCMDEQTKVQGGSVDETWLTTQAPILAQTLCRIAEEQAMIELEKCSGGYQHDLLWMLEGRYLDEAGQPFVFISHFSTFLMQQLCAYIEHCLAPKEKAARLDFYRSWQDWSLQPAGQVSPVLALLREGGHVNCPLSSSSNDSIDKQVKDAWCPAAVAFVSQQCRKMAISIGSYEISQIEAYVDMLPELDFTTNDPWLLLLGELLGAKPVDVTLYSSISGLVSLRNAVLVKVQAILLSEWQAFTPAYHNSLSALLRVEAYVQSLLRYSNMVLIGAQDAVFEQFRLALTQGLCDFFSMYQWGDVLSPVLMATIDAYVKGEQAFKAQSSYDMVTNFFANLSATPSLGHFNALWGRVSSVFSSPLSDDAIYKLLRAGQETTLNVTDAVPFVHEAQIDSSTITYLSSYDINRLLLHGLMVAPSAWSSVFKQTLQAVCTWLLTPASAEDSVSLRALKQAYPFWLLPNMFVMTCLTSEQILPPEGGVMNWNASDRYSFCYTSAIYSRHAPYLLPHLNTLLKKADILLALLRVPLDQFGAEQRTQLWTALIDTNHLPSLLQNVAELILLLRLSPEQLNLEQRTRLWAALIDANHLVLLIKNGHQLSELLKLSPDVLSEAQRVQLLTALMQANRLPALIENGYQLSELLKLSPDVLSEVQCVQLLTALMQANRLPILIEDGYQLSGLLKLSPDVFSGTQRTQLWAALMQANCLPTLIKSGYQLSELLKLSPDVFSKTQRAQLLTALAQANRLPTLIEHGYQLSKLLELSLDVFSKTQRAQLWAALMQANRLPTLIENGYQLSKLLELSLGVFSKTQRAQLLTALAQANRLPTLIEHGYQLSDLLELSPNVFSETERTRLLTALAQANRLPDLFQNWMVWTQAQNRLSELITNGHQLSGFLKLSLKEFDEFRRRRVWDAVRNRLPEIIESGDQLTALLQLSSAQLPLAWRTQVWNVMQYRLPEFIKNSGQLTALLQLSPAQLPLAWRTQVWEAVQHRLSEFIQRGDQLTAFLQLSPAQFPLAWRAQVWNVVQNRLPDFIQGGDQLTALLQLSPEQLSPERRTQVWEAVRNRLSEFIQRGDQLTAFLQLSPAQLPLAWRTQVWEAVQHRLSEFIQRGDQLTAFLQLSPAQFPLAWRAQVWNVVQNRLSELIKNGNQLSALLRLSLEELNLEQRAQVWAVVQNQLPDFIQCDDQLSALLQLDPVRLPPAWRKQVWAAAHVQLPKLICMTNFPSNNLVSCLSKLADTDMRANAMLLKLCQDKHLNAEHICRYVGLINWYAKVYWTEQIPMIDPASYSPNIQTLLAAAFYGQLRRRVLTEPGKVKLLLTIPQSLILLVLGEELKDPQATKKVMYEFWSSQQTQPVKIASLLNAFCENKITQDALLHFLYKNNENNFDVLCDEISRILQHGNFSCLSYIKLMDFFIKYIKRNIPNGQIPEEKFLSVFVPYLKKTKNYKRDELKDRDEEALVCEIKKLSLKYFSQYFIFPKNSSFQMDLFFGLMISRFVDDPCFLMYPQQYTRALRMFLVNPFFLDLKKQSHIFFDDSNVFDSELSSLKVPDNINRATNRRDNVAKDLNDVYLKGLLDDVNHSIFHDLSLNNLTVENINNQVKNKLDERTTRFYESYSSHFSKSKAFIGVLLAIPTLGLPLIFSGYRNYFFSESRAKVKKQLKDLKNYVLQLDPAKTKIAIEPSLNMSLSEEVGKAKGQANEPSIATRGVKSVGVSSALTLTGGDVGRLAQKKLVSRNQGSHGDSDVSLAVSMAVLPNVIPASTATMVSKCGLFDKPGPSVAEGVEQFISDGLSM